MNDRSDGPGGVEQRPNTRLFQLAGALCLLGVILGIAVGLFTGEWPVFLENERFPAQPFLPVIIIALFGVSFLFLAHKLERGRAWAAGGLTCVSAFGMIIAVLHVAISISALYETVFFLLLTVNGLTCWVDVQRQRKQVR